MLRALILTRSTYKHIPFLPNAGRVLIAKQALHCHNPHTRGHFVPRAPAPRSDPPTESGLLTSRVNCWLMPKYFDIVLFWQNWEGGALQRIIFLNSQRFAGTHRLLPPSLAVSNSSKKRADLSLKNRICDKKRSPKWSEWQDLNLRPPPPEDGALPD